MVSPITGSVCWQLTQRGCVGVQWKTEFRRRMGSMTERGANEGDYVEIYARVPIYIVFEYTTSARPLIHEEGLLRAIYRFYY